MFKYSIHVLPNSIADLFTSNISINSYNTRNKSKLRQPRSKYECDVSPFDFVYLVWFYKSVSLPCDFLIAVFRESQFIVSPRQHFVNVYIHWFQKCRVINILNFSLTKSFYLFCIHTLHFVSIIIVHDINICLM